MKTFFGGVFIEKIKLMEAGVKYPIKLEYFKTKKEKKNNEVTPIAVEDVLQEIL